MGYKKLPSNIWSLKCDRETEPVAISVYLGSYRKNYNKENWADWWDL